MKAALVGAKIVKGPFTVKRFRQTSLFDSGDKGA